MLLIKIVNDSTGTSDNGNYCYQVLCTDPNPEVEKLTLLSEGEIKNHLRSTGWQELVRKLADKAIDDRETTEVLRFMQMYDRIRFEGET